MGKLLPVGLLALLATVASAQAQDVRGVIKNLDRAINPQEQTRDRPSSVDEDRYWRDYYGNRDDWRDRATRDYGYRDRDSSRDSQQSRLSDRDLDSLFRSEGARRIEYQSLSDSDRRRYDSATPNERRRWDQEFADNARDRWQRMSDADRRRYLDDVNREDRQMSGSSSDNRRR